MTITLPREHVKSAIDALTCAEKTLRNPHSSLDQFKTAMTLCNVTKFLLELDVEGNPEVPA